MNHLITITKNDGTHELFEEQKLVNSLTRVGTPAEVVEEIVDIVEGEMKDGATTDAIYHRAFELLKKHSRHVAVSYSIRRALLELGPEGFPFEKFVARIFHARGFETLTDQTVLGTCITHEIDVVAWNAKQLNMVEAKFHHQFELKSDAKVALYVKARWDDLKKTLFDYGGIKRKLDQFWLVTNTKFTDQAVTYGKCNDLMMIGWNYPEKGNLHDLINEYGLHPITCLTLITSAQKKDLIDKNVILCSDIIKKSDALTAIGIKSEDIARIVEEAKTIVQTTE